VPDSQTISQYVPYLRRYARALTGSQTAGDSYVAATLEAAVADRTILDDPSGSRVALYRLFTKIWGSISINNMHGSETSTLPGEANLANITPLPRQAFLLVALEGFSEAEAARVIDTDVLGLRRLIDETGRELAAQIATDVLIIEDEALIALELEVLVESLGKVKPGLILSDIQLADGSSGLDAVDEMLRSFEVPVIFITAYPERFLTGNRPEPAFLIAKPFELATVSAIASQALFFEHSAQRRDRRTPARSPAAGAPIRNP
jgi:DNA-directed RNA polymerase specialized sigma24 family protein